MSSTESDVSRQDRSDNGIGLPPSAMTQALEAGMWLQVPIFRHLGYSGCAELARRYPASRFASAEPIASAGDPAKHLYVVLAGTVRLFHRSPEGRELTAKLLRAPNVFGDVELLQGTGLLTHAVALDDVYLARYPADAYRALLQEDPESAWEHLVHLGAASCVTARNERQAFAAIEQRVAAVLLDYADLYGRRLEGELIIDHALSQDDIARALGVVRRSVAKVMAEWSKAGIVTKGRGVFALRQPGVLEDLARGLRGGLRYQMGISLGVQDGLARAEATLVVAAAGGIRRVTVGDEVVIGGEARCDLPLASEGLVARHCRVFRGGTGGRYWIEGLDPVATVRVNGRQVRRAVLRDGDVICIAELRLRFELRMTASA